MTKTAWILVAMLLGGGGTRPPDRVELKNGETVEGYVLVEKPDELIVLVKSRERRIPIDQVASVRTAAQTLEEVLDRHERLPRETPGRRSSWRGSARNARSRERRRCSRSLRCATTPGTRRRTSSSGTPSARPAGR
jgi:hypothetical protein